MSTLEERRAERRRKRQMEEEHLNHGTKSADELHADVQERLARRRKERDEKMAAMVSSVATVNGEDDLEKRRRERREARIRGSGGGDTDYSTEDDYSSRQNRRRGTDEDITEDTPSVNDTPVTKSVPDTSEEDAAAERRRRQQEEEEAEEARQRAEQEAEAQQERQALEQERQRQEESRREEQARQRREEQEELERQEEEERQARSFDYNDDESGSPRSDEPDIDGPALNPHGNKLFIDESELLPPKNSDADDKFERVRKWNEESSVETRHMFGTDKKWIKSEVGSDSFVGPSDKSKSLDRNSSAVKEVNNNKVKDKLNKFEHLKSAESDSSVKPKDKKLLIPTVEKDGLKGKLKLFEKEIKEQEVAKKEGTSLHTTPKPKIDVTTAQSSQKLTQKLQHFETAAKSQSATKPPASRDVQRAVDTRDVVPRRNVLDRWKSVEKQAPEAESPVKSPERKASLNKRLSGNTEFIASKYLEKAKTPDEAPPASPTKSLDSGSKRNSLTRTMSQDQSRLRQGSDTSSENVDENLNQSRTSKVTDRWSFREDDVVGSKSNNTPKKGLISNGSISHSRESSSDKTGSVHSRGSSFDASSDGVRRCSQYSQEDEAEARRLREEERARKMAEDESKKKRGKRKGLGGLTPEKKKKLKELIADVTYSEDERLEKDQELSQRLPPLPDDLDLWSPDELRKLIKSLHEKLAQIHSEAYDVEFKLHKQDKEVADLNMKITDSKGKFAKPVLRKVNKTEQKFAAISQKQDKIPSDFREALKSTHDDEE